VSKNKQTNSNYSTNTHEQKDSISLNHNSDYKESINKSFDETKDNINRSIDESRNQIPRINSVVNSYQEQSLQTAREISGQYLESQKQVINSLQSAWRPYNEAFNGYAISFFSPDAAVKAYTTFVSTIADNTVSAMRLSNNVIFSTLDAWKPALQQAQDLSGYISNTGVNAARVFEQNLRQVETNVNGVAANSNLNSSASSTSTSKDSTTY
jgi:hypothetical protein